VETWRFVLDNFDDILFRTGEHLSLIGVAIGLAIAVGVPLGIAITRRPRLAGVVLYLGAILMTIPSMAMFGIMIPILSQVGHGIGYVPAVIAVLLYSLLPIVRNSYTAINNVDPALREAARGMGMSPRQRLWQIEIPLAIPVIMAGVRSAAVLNIGIMAIAAYIGAGGLGVYITRGISQTDPRQLITGAVAISVLAIVVDLGLWWLQKRLTPTGVDLNPETA